MSKYEIAVFDVDGTLLDTTEGVIAAVNYTIEQMGFEKLDDEQLTSFIGPPIQESFAKAYGLHGDILQEIATCFRNRYKDYELLKAKPYEGIYNLMKTLSGKGVSIAIATYKRQDYAETILKHFEFDKYTDIFYGADHENKLKKVDIIKKCMIQLGVNDYTKAVMIGDSSHDAIGAESIGMDFIGVTYGFEFRNDSDVLKYKSIGSASSPFEILKYFE